MAQLSKLLALEAERNKVSDPLLEAAIKAVRAVLERDGETCFGFVQSEKAGHEMLGITCHNLNGFKQGGLQVSLTVWCGNLPRPAFREKVEAELGLDYDSVIPKREAKGKQD